jgi:hypothetical protein
VVPEGRDALPRAGRVGSGPDRATPFRRTTPTPRCPTSRRSPTCAAGCRPLACIPRICRWASISTGGCRARDALGRLSRYDRRQDGCRKRRAGRGAEAPERGAQDRRHGRSGWSCATGRVACLLTTAGRIEADQVVLAAGAVHTPVLLLGRRGACRERPRQPVRPGRAQLHEPQLFGASGFVEAAQPVRLSEDAVSERLVFDRWPER